jgi:hypothetical protein
MIFFEYFKADPFSGNPKFGIDWLKYHKNHKYKGFMVRFIIPIGELDIDIVYKNVAEFRKMRARG